MRRVCCITLLVISGVVFAVSSPVAAAAKPVSAEKWAGSVCSALATWQKALIARRDATVVATVPSVEQRVLTAYLTGMAKSTRALEVRLARSGNPKVAHGKELAGALRTAFADARRAFLGAKEQVGALDTSSSDAFTQGVTDVQQEVSDGVAAAHQALAEASTTYPSPSLATALSTAAACGRLSSTVDPPQ